jgi:hypothetical protein
MRQDNEARPAAAAISDVHRAQFAADDPTPNAVGADPE